MSEFDWPSCFPGLVALKDERDRLHTALEELLRVAERIRGGDASLDPEEWYAVRDHARVALDSCVVRTGDASGT